MNFFKKIKPKVKSDGFVDLNDWKEKREKSDWFKLLDYNTTLPLLKELPLFKLEPFVLIGATFAAFFLIALELIGFLQGGGVRAFFILVTVMWALFLYKWWKYLPHGNKVIVERNFGSTGVKLSVEPIPKDRQIHFDKNDETPPAQLGNVKCHFEVGSGKPYVRVVEGYWTNFNLIEALKSQLSTRTAKEFNNIVKVTYSTAWQAAIANFQKGQSLAKNPLFWVLVIICLVLIVAVVLQFAGLNSLKELEPTLHEFAKNVQQLKQFVQAVK